MMKVPKKTDGFNGEKQDESVRAFTQYRFIPSTPLFFLCYDTLKKRRMQLFFDLFRNLVKFVQGLQIICRKTLVILHFAQIFQGPRGVFRGPYPPR